MDVITPFAPTPGDAKPGNLYADLGTRTLWLGVDLAVDSTGAVLISDIVGLQADIDQTLLDAKAYTDTKILTRAPTVHTHTSSQITDFTAAVTAVASAIPSLSYTRGMILMYSGSLADIGVGPLAGWTLCDGSNGSPDLRERFVLAAGSRAIGSKNAATTFDTTAGGGGHDHIVNSMVLDISQIPNHAHSGATTGRNVGHTHNVQGNTGIESADHAHDMGIGSGQTGAGKISAGNSSGSANLFTGGRNAAHYHSFNVNSGGESGDHLHYIYAEGGGQAHSHTIVGGGGAHSHTITNQQLRETLPFYALAFIMKL
jgi:hypothetical protein